MLFAQSLLNHMNYQVIASKYARQEYQAKAALTDTSYLKDSARKFARCSTVLTLSLMLTLCLSMVSKQPTCAQSVSILHSFAGIEGNRPTAGLIQASDGNFYGTTWHGGNDNVGTVFQITPSGSLTTLHSFTNGSDGGHPYASLIQGSDGNFYGTTPEGGINNYGTIFKMTSSGSLITLHAFAGYSDGANPYASLIQGSDGNFYGTTQNGGSGYGTIFKISASGSLTTIYSFTGGSDGAYPFAGLIQGSDGDFYGTTGYGGIASGYSGYGTVFKISLSGSLSTLYSFTGGSVGVNPSTSLTQASDGNFYGTTYSGGINNYGTVFKITPAGSLTTLHSFSYSDGSNPHASLIQGSDGNFYGTTYGGGTSNYGTVFQMTPSGSLTTLHSFTNDTDGGYPYASLIQLSDGNFYGTTEQGGSNTIGAIFKITSSGSLTTFYSFTGGNDGGFSQAALIQGSDGNFYSTTEFGGAEDVGTVFKITPAGSETLLHSFIYSSERGNTYASLIQGSDGNFYGTTPEGGVNNDGTVFKITSSGSLTTLHAFSYSDGSYPNGLIQGSDGNFYGTTQNGGANGYGTIFQITPSGNLTTLYSFTGAGDGAAPYAALIQASDGNFYGTTRAGGIVSGYSGYGTVFKITPTGSLTTLYAFTGGNDGSYPFASLVQGADGNLYGTTSSGGVNYGGTVFQITPSGSLTTLYSFTGFDGGYPVASLIQAGDGNFYGTTLDGGANNKGTIFQMTPSGSLTTLYSFAGSPSDGDAPAANLIQGSDGNFYGTTVRGGANNVGTVFVLALSATLASLSPSSASAGSSTFTLTINGSGFASSAIVQWTENGTTTALATTFVSSSQVTATVPASLIASGGTAAITVNQYNTISNALPFTVNNPAPILTSTSPTSIDAGGPGFILTVNGSGFVSTSSVKWNGSPLTTTYVSTTQLTASVPSSLTANPGKAKITVVSPTPGGGVSLSKTFTILVTTVAVTGASVVKNGDGSYTVTVSLQNTGYKTAANTKITASTLGAAATSTPLPASVGDIAGGAAANVSLNYSASAGASGKTAAFKVSGTFTGGTFKASLKLKLP